MEIYSKITQHHHLAIAGQASVDRDPYGSQCGALDMSMHNGPDRTLWYNQDPGTLFSETSEPLTPEHVDVMVDEVADAEVDVFLVNVNMWRTNYPSEVWETWWDGFDEWAAANPPLETDAMARTLHWHHPRHPKRHRMIEQMQRLAEQGCDYLERSVQRCRDRGVSPAVSIRTNDTHDSEPDSQYFSDFYRNHPELWLSSSRVTGTGGLDYDQAAPAITISRWSRRSSPGMTLISSNSTISVTPRFSTGTMSPIGLRS